jgi:hypothetical protein
VAQVRRIHKSTIQRPFALRDRRESRGRGLAEAEVVIKYLNLGLIPMNFGFCTSEKSFKKEMKRLGVESPPSWIAEGADATCHDFLRSDGSRASIICMSARRCVGKDRVVISGLIVHECTHAFDLAIEAMREKAPSQEFKAYTMQYMSQFCMWEMFDELDRLKKVSK